MAMLGNIIGFSLFGLAARLGQLGIQKKNLFTNPAGHAIAMGVFGYGGYWAYRWEIRSAELIAEKRAEIQERRQQRAAQIEAREGA